MIDLFHRNFDTETEPVGGPTDIDLRIGADGPSTEAPDSYSPEQVETMLAQARAAAIADGKATGAAEASAAERATREARLTDALEAIGNQLAELSRQNDARRLEIEAELTGLILGIGERILPDVMANCAIDQVSARIRAGLRIAAGSAAIAIRMSPEIKDAVSDRLSELGTGHNGRLPVEVLGDPDMAEGAVRMEWRNGFMEYDLGRACDEVLETLRDSTEKLNSQSGKVT